MYGPPQSDREKALAKEVIERHDRLVAKRLNWETHWQECMDYIVPRKAEITTKKTTGSKRGQELFDSTAIMANQLLGGALHGMLTNASTRFFDLVMGDTKLDDADEVKGWLQDVGDRMFSIFNKSNFQTEVHEVYIDLGSIGTSCVYMGENDESVVHFSARSMKEIYVDENNLGLIDTVHRLFEWNPRQIIQEFGEAHVPPYVLEQYKKGCEDMWQIIHEVMPRSDEKPDPRKFGSVYVLKEQGLVLSEGGFREFPYAVPRWTKASGEIYGRGPGMDVLADIKMVNKMMETTLKGAQMTVNPALMVTDDGVIGNVRLTPGGITVVRASNEAPIRPLITNAAVDFGYQAVEDVRKRIRSGFYVDQLQLNEGPQMTATEVTQRTEEKLRLMGPVLGRQHFEFLRPVIDRVFGIMLRKGLIPDAPDAIKGKNFDVRYSSLIARAQRMSEGQNFARAMSLAAPIMQVHPESADVVNADKAVKYVLDLHGVPHTLERTDQEIAKIRDDRQKAQAAAAQQQQQQAQAEMAGKVMPGMAQLQQAQAAQQKR